MSGWRSCDVTRCCAMSLFFNYTFLLSSLRVHKVQIIVNLSCLVPLKSSWAVQYDSTYISYLTKQKNDNWKKNSQKSCFVIQLHGGVQTADQILWYFSDSVQVYRDCWTAYVYYTIGRSKVLAPPVSTILWGITNHGLKWRHKIYKDDSIGGKRLNC